MRATIGRMPLSEGQVQIQLTMWAELRDLIDEVRDCDRTFWIRRQIVKGLREAGKNVSDKLAAPPSRAGKGGRPRKVTYGKKEEETQKAADDPKIWRIKIKPHKEKKIDFDDPRLAYVKIDKDGKCTPIFKGQEEGKEDAG